MPSTPSDSAFAELLRETITDASRRLGKLKKELARDCGLRPDRLSHLQNGQRKPAHREVLTIGRGLRLDERATNRLLEAAGFVPLSADDIDESPAAALVGRLSEPERTVAQAEAEHDVEVLQQAWSHYVTVRIRNEVRDWEEAGELNKLGDDHHWAVRAIAVRFRAKLCLADATSLQYLHQLAEAEKRCREGLVWADDAASERFRIMLLSRLGSIKRLQGDYDHADRTYGEALAVLDAWEATDSPDEARANWRAHWRARMQRMLALVELCKGRPKEALERLSPAFEHFARGPHHDELSQVLYARGWACSLRGDFEEAVSWNAQGLEHATKHLAEGREDERLLLQGHLYLGGNHLDLDEPAKARAELHRALDYGRRRRLAHYLEVGRVHRQLGRLEVREGHWERAHAHLKAAIDFYTEHEDLVLLATAHNGMGDYYLARPGPAHRQRALDHYVRALELAGASKPPNTYYECASLLNICRARIRTREPEIEQGDIREDHAASPAERRFEDLVEEVRLLGQEHQYRNHLARLAVIEAEYFLGRGDAARARTAASEALHLGRNFSPLLLTEVRAALARLDLPTDSLEVLPDSGRSFRRLS